MAPVTCLMLNVQLGLFLFHRIPYLANKLLIINYTNTWQCLPRFSYKLQTVPDTVFPTLDIAYEIWPVEESSPFRTYRNGSPQEPGRIGRLGSVSLHPAEVKVLPLPTEQDPESVPDSQGVMQRFVPLQQK